MISLTHLNDVTFDASTEQNHQITIDANSTTAPCPTELLVMALASCCSTDVVTLIQEQGGVLNKLTVQTEETLREIEPKIFTAIQLNFHIHASNISEHQVNQIITDALEKHCHVCLMLGNSINIGYSLLWVDS